MKTFFTDGDRNDGGPNSGNDCVIVENDGYWEDEECDASHQFVCMWIKGKISSTYLHNRTSHTCRILYRQSIVRDNIPRHFLLLVSCSQTDFVSRHQKLETQQRQSINYNSKLLTDVLMVSLLQLENLEVHSVVHAMETGNPSLQTLSVKVCWRKLYLMFCTSLTGDS